MSTEKNYTKHSLEFWGGIECTINRINNSYFDQLNFSGHYGREEDIRLISELGIKTLRYPVLWEKHAPELHSAIDWTFTKKKLDELGKYGITPVAGLLHHGSGPRYTNLLDDNFPELFASYAGKVAKQFPWLQYYTPINEPLTTARFSGLYGLWYPHISNDVSFAKMLLNQVKGIILAMKEIRKINPDAKLIQTEDLSKTYSTSSLSYQAAFENERRWLTYDLLCGKLCPGHTMWNYFLRLGIKEETLIFFIDNATFPDTLGCNYYITSERYLDDDLKNYPAHTYGGNEIQQYADVEAIRVDHNNPSGLKVLLEETWKRYELPIAITEAHLNSGREDQLRWLNEICSSCYELVERGINIKAVTFWSLFGAFGWNNLLTSEPIEYEPGAFDLRSTKPRPTAIATFIKDVIRREKYTHTVTGQKGWWHQPTRFYKKETDYNTIGQNFLAGSPLIIIGTGLLGEAFSKICSKRNIQHILTGVETSSINSEKNINALLDTYNPWAVINATSFPGIDDAEDVPGECFKVNTLLPVLLSKACKERNISLMTFSSDLVFDGQKKEAYHEKNACRPSNIYGLCKAMAEKEILNENPDALIIRTGPFFGPWDKNNFVIDVLNTLSAGDTFYAINDLIISPTYVPHLVAASLDLLIDKESGIWHLANDGSLTWRQFAVKIADKGGFDSRLITGITLREKNLRANRPKNSALRSQRGNLLPSLDEAIASFFKERTTLPIPSRKTQETLRLS